MEDSAALEQELHREEADDAPAAEAPAASAPSAPKSSGSLKSILLLIGLLVLAGAAMAVYQLYFKGGN